MNTNIRYFLKKISVCIVVIFVIFAAVLCCADFSTKKENLFAAETTIDNETKIYEIGGIISQSLWNALKVFYNNNKTNEMSSIKVDTEGNMYLTVSQFKDFPISKLDLSSKEISSITNLSIFDLSAFDEIDLSNNNISSIGAEFKQLTQLKKLNLKGNQLSEFSFEALAIECYSQNLTELNISKNKIVNCNLKDISYADIDATFNRITKQSLTLPTNTNLKVNLSDNFILSPNTENTNVTYGLQGVKNSESFVVGTTIEYYGIDGISEAKIYLIESDKNDASVIIETEVKTLSVGDTHTFSLGYFTIKFSETRENINIYIAPKAPTLKMFKDNQEIELNHMITSPVTLKFFGDDNATFVYQINSGEVKQSGEVEIKTVGINNVVVYQVVDGYLSFATTFYIEYNPPQTNSWIFVLGGAVIFVLAFYFAIKYIPKISMFNIGKKGNNKTDLD